MRKLIIVLICLVLTGCATMVGPISGEKYTVDYYEPEQLDWDTCYLNYSNIVSNKKKYINECREYAIKKHPEWEGKYTQAILNGKIMLGMNDLQVLASWGKPKDINKTVTAWGTHEQWIYGNFYVYFRNGKLSSWQEW